MSELDQLARKAAQGDRESLRELLVRVAPPMKGAVRAMVPASEVEDVVQEALIGLVRSLPKFRFESSVKHFACRIAVRQALQSNRGRKRRTDAYHRAEEQGGARPQEPAELSEDRDHCRRTLSELIADLPEAQAEALIMRFVWDYTLQEIAEATATPKNTVRSRLRLAKRALVEKLEATPEIAALFGQVKG